MDQPNRSSAGHPSSSKRLTRPFDAIHPNSERLNSLDSPTKRQKTNPKSMLRFQAVPKSDQPDPVMVRAGSVSAPVFDPHRGSHYLVLTEHRSEFDPDKFFQGFWEKLEVVLKSIFQSQKLAASVQDLYVGIESVCRQGNSEALYKKLARFCEKLIIFHQKQLLDKNQAAFAGNSSSDRSTVLSQVLALWRTWRNRVSVVASIFAFLDQFYAFHNSCPLVLDIGVDLFRKHIFSIPKVQQSVVAGSCEMVGRHREGADIMELFKETTGMYRNLSVYSSVFEPAFLGVSQEFIRSWAAENSVESDLPTYTNKALRLIEDELQRCDTLDLSKSTRWGLISLLDKHLITCQRDKLVDDVRFSQSMDEDSMDDLRNLYILLRRVKLEAELAPLLGHWIEEAGSPIVLDPINQTSMVYMLIAMKTKLDTVWESCFQSDAVIGNYITATFTRVTNSRTKNKHGRSLPSKLPEMISKYFDYVLKGGIPIFPQKVARSQATAKESTSHAEIKANSSDKTEEDQVKIMAYLQEGFDVFRYLEGKSAMERIYRADLARRLLLSRNSNSKAEQHVLTQFKSECGDSFVEAMDLMFQDINRARLELANNPQLGGSSRSRQRRSPIEFSAIVLSSAAWPTYPDVQVKLPTELQAQQDEYEKGYQDLHANHTVSWKPGLAQCVVKAHFPLGDKELLVTGFQALVLAQFSEVDDGEEVEYTIIQKNTGIPDSELKRTLQSLASAKIRPLTKHPRGKDVANTDKFSVNDGFTHERYRVKISQIQHREIRGGSNGDSDSDDDGPQIEDRLMELQSTIMRRLKVKKVIGQDELIAETMEAVKSRGPATKERILEALNKLYERDLLGKQPDGQYSWDIN